METRKGDGRKINLNYKLLEKDIIFGFHPVSEALANHKSIDKILISKEKQPGNLKLIIENAKKNGVELKFVPNIKLDKITRKNHQGIIAFCSPVEFVNWEEIVTSCFENGKDPLVIVLDRITDVRNFGSICRSAECFGADVIVVPTQNAAAIGSDAMKTSAGALSKIPVSKSANLKIALLAMKQYGFSLVAATEKAKKHCYETSLKGPLALIMGNEETGISPEYLKMCNEQVKIPMQGEISSLNVAVSAGIILYEITRQKHEHITFT